MEKGCILHKCVLVHLQPTIPFDSGPMACPQVQFVFAHMHGVCLLEVLHAKHERNPRAALLKGGTTEGNFAELLGISATLNSFFNHNLAM